MRQPTLPISRRASRALEYCAFLLRVASGIMKLKAAKESLGQDCFRPDRALPASADADVREERDALVRSQSRAGGPRLHCFRATRMVGISPTATSNVGIRNGRFTSTQAVESLATNS